MKEIPLTQGKVARVDDEDFEAVSSVKWYARRHHRTFYAIRNMLRPDGKWVHEHLHQVVLARKLGRPIAKGMEADHKNGDGLDNQRGNLFEATGGQNQRNCRRHSKNPSSRYLGVCLRKLTGKWFARINVDGKSVYLGYHATELEAALAREAYITAHPELNARSNFGGQVLIKD